ncbi:hypothetical protein Tco_1306349 [Tanacetum coccineum]
MICVCDCQISIHASSAELGIRLKQPTCVAPVGRRLVRRTISAGTIGEWLVYYDFYDILRLFEYYDILILMAKLSAYDSDVLSEVPIYDHYQDNNVIDQSVHEMQYFEQPVFVDNSNIDITSDNNVISYDQYMKENESEVVQDTTSSEQQDAMIMFVIEEMSNQEAKCNAVNQENTIVNESLTTDLER